jgi:hypothetical protein
MKYYRRYTKNNLAAGVVLLLAAILITACGDEAAQAPIPVTATFTITAPPAPANTPALATATSTPSPPLPTDTPPAATPTLTATPGKTATSVKKTSTFTPEPTNKAVAQAGPKSTDSAPPRVYETTITLPTYPIKDYLVEQIDPLYNIPVFYFSRAEFEAAAPDPRPVDYSGIVLENDYLRLTFLPELGGRLYSVVVKASEQEIFYHNKVVKPSRYGVLLPYEANWWLGTGGMEWAYPTQEHGYRWGVPWNYEVSQSAAGATIVLSDTAPDRVGVEVSVTLPADRAVFTVAPKLVNNRPEAVPVQFWLNAALALAPDSMSPDTQFIVPVDQITVHSRGQAGWTIPGAREESPWPLVGETDLRDYGQWADYLGFFIPNMEAPFMGAYNPETNLGVARLIEPGAVPGNKLFAFGSAFLDRSYTDDDSQYFEIWGGANIGFWPEDDILVAGGGVLQWQESWWPLAGLGGLTWANQEAAIHINQAGDSHNLSILLSRPRQVTLTVLAGETPILTESFSANPVAPLQRNFATSDTPVRIQLTDDDGTVLLDFGNW